MKVLAYIAGAILIFFGVLFLWASFGEAFNAGWFVTGLITVVLGFGAIWFGARIRTSPAGEDNNVTLKIDLSGDVKLESLKCENCGGSLTPDNVKMVAGAPVVNCPYCGTSYQLTEEPKW